MKKLTLKQLSKTSGICQSTLLNYIEGRFKCIPREYVKCKFPSGAIRKTKLYTVSEEDIKKLVEYKTYRLRKDNK